MPPAGFEPASPTSGCPNTYALDRAATGNSYGIIIIIIIIIIITITIIIIIIKGNFNLAQQTTV
jgi:hypothetical protein